MGAVKLPWCIKQQLQTGVMLKKTGPCRPLIYMPSITIIGIMYNGLWGSNQRLISSGLKGANLIIFNKYWHCQANILQKLSSAASWALCSASANGVWNLTQYAWNYTGNTDYIQVDFTPRCISDKSSILRVTITGIEAFSNPQGRNYRQGRCVSKNALVHSRCAPGEEKA